MDLPETHALPIAILTNELVTNSLKHGFSDGRTGTIEVGLCKNGELLLEVRDDGVGCPTDAKAGVGSRLMQAMAQQLRGTLTREFANPGCRTIVRVPFPS